MTLIEVVAGLALLASVLGGILAVKARLTRQAREVERRQQAIEAADAMLREWLIDPARFPKLARGIVPGHPDLAWRTGPLRNRQAETLGGQVVRFEISGAAAGADRAPLVVVEVVVAAEPKHDASVHAH